MFLCYYTISFASVCVKLNTLIRKFVNIFMMNVSYCSYDDKDCCQRKHLCPLNIWVLCRIILSLEEYTGIINKDSDNTPSWFLILIFDHVLFRINESEFLIILYPSGNLFFQTVLINSL